MTKREAKTAVSNLRKALKTLNSTQISHNATCELLAQSFGYRNWSAFSATLQEDAPGATAAIASEKYPLRNTGQFDFAKSGVLLQGLNFEELSGTLEDIQDCVSGVSSVTRDARGLVDVEYAGETEVNWDGQRTRLDEQGYRLWVSTGCSIFSETQCVLVPEDEAQALNTDDPSINLPVRSALIQALLEYLTEKKQLVNAREELTQDKCQFSAAVDNAEMAIGFSTIYPERLELLNRLKSLN
jgi:Glyoxalase superfamily protein